MGIFFMQDSFGSIKSETFDSGTVSSSIAWNPTTKVMTETITLPSGKNIVETTLKGLPKTLEYDGSKLLQYNYGTGNVLNNRHEKTVFASFRIVFLLLSLQ